VGEPLAYLCRVPGSPRQSVVGESRIERLPCERALESATGIGLRVGMVNFPPVPLQLAARWLCSMTRW